MIIPRVRPWILAAQALAATSAAHAVTTQNANICVPPGSNSFAGLEYDDGAVANILWYDTLRLICPVLRSQEAGPAGLSVWVAGYMDLYHQTTSCTLVSLSYTGQTLGWTSFTIDDRPGPYDTQLTLPQSQVPPWSSQTLICSLPPAGELWDIEGAF